MHSADGVDNVGIDAALAACCPIGIH